MERNLKINLLKISAMKMALNKTSLAQEHHNKMVLLKEKIELYKKWQEL